MNKCTNCGSYAINPYMHGRGGENLDLCDVCYWRARFDALRDAVAWELECNYLWEFGPVLSNIANDELLWSIKRVRAEVDDLLCKKQSKEISNA